MEDPHMPPRQQKQAAPRSKRQKPVAKRSKTLRQPAAKPKRNAAAAKLAARSDRPHCGLCGATGNLTMTECCNEWICDDEDQYVIFSYRRNSCHRNHSRYTLCGFHLNERHPGQWQNCAECRAAIEPEIYAYFGTNEYNFQVLENPPAYEPTHCSACGRVIVMAEGGYS